MLPTSQSLNSPTMSQLSLSSSLTNYTLRNGYSTKTKPADTKEQRLQPIGLLHFILKSPCHTILCLGADSSKTDVTSSTEIKVNGHLPSDNSKAQKPLQRRFSGSTVRSYKSASDHTASQPSEQCLPPIV